jgi:fucose permease
MPDLVEAPTSKDTRALYALGLCVMGAVIAGTTPDFYVFLRAFGCGTLMYAGGILIGSLAPTLSRRQHP